MNYKMIIDSYLEATEKEDPEEVSEVRRILEEKPSSEIFINSRNHKYISNLFNRDMMHKNRSVRT